MPYPDKPTLKQTSTEFLLFIHPAEKERAKVIGGYRWDTQRKCWVYPRTKRVYDALIAEFGDQLIAQPGIGPFPQPPPGDPLEDLRKKNKLLAEENERLQASIIELSRTTSLSQPEFQQLRAEVTKRDAQLADLQRRLIEAQEQHKNARSEADSLRSELKRRDADKSIQTQIKAMALEATGNDDKFAALLEQLDFGTNLPIKLARFLERELRNLLVVPEDDRVDLNELLQQAKDAEILPRDAIDLAHLIRKQRNIIAHADAYEKTYQARSIMCLFASALLWPEFPE